MYAVEKVEVILTVPSVEETAAWYERALGWKGHYDVFDAQGRCTFGSVMLGDMSLVASGERPFTGFNLSRFDGEPGSYGEAGRHVVLFIAVDRVDAVYARLVEAGIAPDAPPEDQPWGGRTFTVRDLNGFALAFYQVVEQVDLEEVRRRYEQARGG